MSKKVKQTKEELDRMAQEIEEKKKELFLTEERLRNEEQAELDRLQRVKDQIEEIGKQEDLFVGVILTRDDVFHIIGLMIDKQENVRIPVMVYPNE